MCPVDSAEFEVFTVVDLGKQLHLAAVSEVRNKRSAAICHQMSNAQIKGVGHLCL